MAYTKNNKRYSNNQLARMGVTDPLASGFVKLIDVKPAYNKYTHKLKDIGTENNAKVYEVVALEGVELERKQEELQAITIKNVTDSIDNFIQSKLDEYNKANGTMFKDINAIAKYTIDTTYTHYPFCNAILNWNIQVWETARGIQAEVLAGTRELPNDIISELPTLE